MKSETRMSLQAERPEGVDVDPGALTSVPLTDAPHFDLSHCDRGDCNRDGGHLVVVPRAHDMNIPIRYQGDSRITSPSLKAWQKVICPGGTRDWERRLEPPTGAISRCTMDRFCGV